MALASMLAKYLREVFMRQFNRFWLGHVDGLKPTAGYPGDCAAILHRDPAGDEKAQGERKPGLAKEMKRS